MSETTVYLIPTKSFEVGEFKSRIEKVFEKLQVIDGYYAEENNWFAAGQNAKLLFDRSFEDENPPFEYVEIHDTGNKRLLPEGLQEPVYCPQCRSDVRDDVNDLLFEITEKEYDEKKEIDITTAELVCPNCSQTSILSALSYNEKIAFADAFLCFVAVLEEINKNKLIEIEHELGFSFDLIYGSI